MGRQGTSRLGNDIRLRQFILFASIDNRRNGIIDIFLNRIIHTIRCRWTGTVIIYSQSASYVYKINVISHPFQLHIKLRSFFQSCLYTTDIGHLTAYMKMNQLKRIGHLIFFKNIESVQKFTGIYPELTYISSWFFPFTTPWTSQLDPDSDIRFHIHFLSQTSDGFQLHQFLHHQKNPFPHFLSQQSQFDITFIFISITNDHGLIIDIDRKYRMQLWLRACFQTDIEFIPMTDNLFNDRTHLIDLDRIDNEILSRIAIFPSSSLKTIRNFLDPIIQDIRESQKYRGFHITNL